MTTDDKIDRLRRELSEYHVQVREHIARDEHLRVEMNVLAADFYGLPGDSANVGVMGDVATLKHSRRWMLIGLRGAWALLLVVGGAVLAKIL